MGRLLTGNKAGDLFGCDLDLSENGGKVLVSAYGSNYIQIFEYMEHNSVWKSKLVLNGKEGEAYGYSVAISGNDDRGIIGAPFARDRIGYARVYDFKTFKFVHEIPGDISGAEFGKSVAMSLDGSVATLGAPSAGFVFVTEYNERENSWSRLGYRISIDQQEFGLSLALSEDGNMIAIGAPYNSYYGPMAGRGYIFEYVGTNVMFVDWEQLEEDFYGTASFEMCGAAIALSSKSKMLALSCPGAKKESGKVSIYGNRTTWYDDNTKTSVMPP